MASAISSRRLAAIMSGDIVGFSRLMAEYETDTVRALQVLRVEIRRRVEERGGRIVDFRGDDFLAEFPSAVNAVRCASELQEHLCRGDGPAAAGESLLLRIGVHVGDIRVEDDQIFGNGVNVAARLEGLAETGGLCISRTVYEQIDKKLPLAFDPMGARTLKNIPDPVEVFRLCDAHAPDAAEPVPSFDSRPAIAVLPFRNLGSDAEQDYFADGICDDLIALFSAWECPVISSNSSFLYRGQDIDARLVSRELGARYLISGSVRRAESRVRVTAKLTDAATGHDLWADRYDRVVEDIFQIQDEICDNICGALQNEVAVSEMRRASRNVPGSIDAWEWGMKGRALSQTAFTREAIEEARTAYIRSIELDSSLIPSHFGLALLDYMTLVNHLADDPSATIRSLENSARNCMTLSPNSSLSHLASGLANSMTARAKQAITAFERAVEIDPNHVVSLCFLASIILMNGREEEALRLLDRARRLSPRDHMLWFVDAYTGLAHFAAGRYEIAVPFLQNGVRQKPDFDHTHRVMAATFGHLGRIAEGRAALAEAKRLSPSFTIEAWQAAFGDVVSPAFASRLTDGLDHLVKTKSL